MYDVIIVGSGASGLTAGAYLAKAGYSTLILEKEPYSGGLINSFTRDGITFDGGIRALDNAGALYPMLKQLGIQVEFLDNPISIGIEDQVIHVESDPDLKAYEYLLKRLYPDSTEDIEAIIAEIKQIMHYMEIQYGINNPIFLDFKEDRDYFMKEVFPWMFKYALNVRKVSAKNQPVIEYLRKFTTNEALIDIIAQHFFTETPAYFALSYFTLYQDYCYPKGSTGAFIQKLVDFIQAQGGEIQTSTAVKAIDLQNRVVTTQDDAQFEFRNLLWTADQKTLYEMVDLDSLDDHRTSEVVRAKQVELADKRGNDSILSLFISSNLEPGYFKNIASGHFFYTPQRAGHSQAGKPPVNQSWEEIHSWLTRFFELTTYEISIPALRDASLAPPGKSGLIVSVLFDYQLTKYIYDQGWEDQFRELVSETMINVLDQSIYPGLASSVADRFTSTPMTMQKLTGNTDGAITGWAFTNQPMPAESRLVRIANAVNTPLPNVFQAGQWTYSPSGLPVSLITGKLASDKIIKQLRR